MLGTLTALLMQGLAVAMSSQQAEARTSGTVFYVDCSVRTSGDGSPRAPWNSVAAVNGHGPFASGESILVRRGTTCAGRLHPTGSGSAASPIVLGAYGSGARPTIAGGGTPDRTGTITLRNQSYWTVQDLHLTNVGTGAETNAYRSGVLIVNDAGGRLPGISVQRLRIDSVVSNLTPAQTEPREYGGISVLTASTVPTGSGFDGLRVVKNSITKVGRTGIAISNDAFPSSSDRHVSIAGNRVVRTRGDSIILRGSIDSRIDHNVSAHGAAFWPCKQCGPVSPATANAAIWPATSKNVRIEYNEIYGEHKLGGDGEGIDVDLSATNTLVQYNYIHDNEGGGILFCGSRNTIARFNMLENNQLGAFTFIESIPAKNTKIYNNTVYSKVGNNAKVVRSFGTAPSRTNRVKGITFFNNLIYNMDDSGFYTWPAKPSTRTNTYIGVHGLGEPQEVGKGWTDPGLRNPGSGRTGFATVSGYKPTSPKNDPVGSAIPRSVTRDFFGKRLNPSKPPRGAAG